MARSSARWVFALAVLLLLAGLFGLVLLVLGEPEVTDVATIGPDPRPAPAKRADGPPPFRAPAEETPATTAGKPTPPPEDGIRRVRVLGPDDVPLVGVTLEPSPLLEEWKDRSTVTGPDGLADVPWASADDGPVDVHLSGPVPRLHLEVDQPLTTVRFPDLVPVEVEVVDGWTGDSVWGATVRLGGGEAIRVDGAPADLGLSSLTRGDEGHVTLHVTPPDGWTVYGGGDLEFEGTVSRYARRVRLTAVVWPEAALLARVDHADGTPAAGAHVAARWPRLQRRGTSRSRSFRHNAAIPGATATTGPAGRARLHGIPAIPGEFVVISGSTENRWALSGAVRIEAPDLPLEVTVELPAEPGGLRGGAGGGFSTGIGCGRPKSLPSPVGDGALDLFLARHDGTPAGNTAVTLQGEVPGGSGWRVSGRTGADGRIRFDGLPGGTAFVSVLEPGYVLSGSHPVAIAATGTTEHRVTELPGMTVGVQVLDDRGDPAPAAELSIGASGGAWAPVDAAGVQRLVPRTGPDGRARLDRVHPGHLRVTARLGTRTASVTADTNGEIVVRLPAAAK